MIVIVFIIFIKKIIFETFTFIWIVHLVCFVHFFLHLDIWWVCAACLGSHMIFVTVSRRLFRVHWCVCVLGDWTSLLFGVRFIILSSCGVVSVLCLCVCLCSVYVCVSVVTWLSFLLLRVACVWVSFSQSQHPLKKRKQTIKKTRKKTTLRKHTKTNEDNNHKKTAKGITKQEITTKSRIKTPREDKNTKRQNHEKQITWTTDTRDRHTAKNLRRHVFKNNPKE